MGDAPRLHHRCPRLLSSDTLRSSSQPVAYKIRQIAKMVDACAEPAINKTDGNVANGEYSNKQINKMPLRILLDDDNIVLQQEI
jgi:hypothetical protein